MLEKDLDPKEWTSTPSFRLDPESGIKIPKTD